MLKNYNLDVDPALSKQHVAEKIFTSLTTREREILFELMKVGTVKVLANNLNISRFTVNQHLRSIYAKLSVNTKLEAVMFFVSYTHWHFKNAKSENPKDIFCKAKGGSSCDLVVCFSAPLCLDKDFCFLSQKMPCSGIYSSFMHQDNF